MINKEDIKELKISPTGYRKINSVIEVLANNNKYIFKKKNKNLNDTFNYLISRNFNYFPNYYETTNYNVYEYINDTNIPIEERSIDLINLLSLLHQKTTHYKKTDIDEYKIIYEDINNKIEDLEKYFNNLTEEIEDEEYMSPSHYLLIRNITKINSNINYCKTSLEKWYEYVKEIDKKRVVLNHNNLKLSHYLKNENAYFISWDKSKFDMPIYDLYNLYLNEYNNIDFTFLLEEYEKRYPLTEEEKSLLFLLISIPYKIKFNNNEYENTKKVNNLLKYIYNTDKNISEYNS